jgi:hypothetical protein
MCGPRPASGKCGAMPERTFPPHTGPYPVSYTAYTRGCRCQGCTAENKKATDRWREGRARRRVPIEERVRRQLTRGAA